MDDLTNFLKPAWDFAGNHLAEIIVIATAFAIFYGSYYVHSRPEESQQSENKPKPGSME